jgi:acetyltransferase-like isoleucine patch superfamily enzyme
VILVGAGAHATDIAETLEPGFRWCHHSDEFQGYGPYIIGINDPHVRAELAEGFGWSDEAWVHPRAYIGPGCEIGSGTHINYMAAMTRTKVGHHCTVAPGVTICGDVTVGDRVFIGAGAVVRNLVTIGDDAFICMGASVTRDVAAGEKYR